jgi:hypothetical protein
MLNLNAGLIMLTCFLFALFPEDARYDEHGDWHAPGDGGDHPSGT